MTEYRAIRIIESTNFLTNTSDVMGAIEIAKVALEKQIPKSPIYKRNNYSKGQLVYNDTWFCPCCCQSYKVEYDNYEYCPHCGQHIDWRNE